LPEVSQYVINLSYFTLDFLVDGLVEKDEEEEKNYEKEDEEEKKRRKRQRRKEKRRRSNGTSKEVMVGSFQSSDFEKL